MKTFSHACPSWPLKPASLAGNSASPRRDFCRALTRQPRSAVCTHLFAFLAALASGALPLAVWEKRNSIWDSEYHIPESHTYGTTRISTDSGCCCTFPHKMFGKLPKDTISRNYLTLWLPRVSSFKVPCSLTRNIITHSVEDLAFHSLLWRKMIILPISHYITYALCL